MKTAKAKKPRETAPKKQSRLSLYPLDLSTALGAALKTGKPPKAGKSERPKRPGKV
jgi:hypothetical protein